MASPQQAGAELAALPVPLPNPHLALEATVLLTWLGHVSAGLARATTRNPLSPVWAARNIRPVLQAEQCPVGDVTPVEDAGSGRTPRAR